MYYDASFFDAVFYFLLAYAPVLEQLLQLAHVLISQILLTLEFPTKDFFSRERVPRTFHSEWSRTVVRDSVEKPECFRVV